MIIRKLLVSALTILIMGMGTNQTLAAPLIEMPAQIIAGESSIDDVVVDAFEAAASGVKVMLPYADNKVYRIYCQEGFITDLIMAPGEEILSIVGSDSERWKIETSVTGTVVKQLHVFVKPIRRGLEANIIINTNRHVYIFSLVLEVIIIQWSNGYILNQILSICRKKRQTIILH